MGGRKGLPDRLETRYIDVPVRVRYADTDRMGVVYYGTYPVYFEIGRTEYMRNRGFSYRALEEEGYFLVVVGMEVKYYSPATYDDLIIVQTGIIEVKSRAVRFHYKIQKDGVLLVEGKTDHVCTNRDKKATLIPPSLLTILKDGAV